MSIDSILEIIASHASEQENTLAKIETHAAIMAANVEVMAANVEILTDTVIDLSARLAEREIATDEGNQAVVTQPDPDPEETPGQAQPEQPEQPDIDPKQANAYLQRVSANLPGGKPAIRKIMEAFGMTGGLGGSTQDQLRDLIVEVDKQVAAAQNSFE